MGRGQPGRFPSRRVAMLIRQSPGGTKPEVVGTAKAGPAIEPTRAPQGSRSFVERTAAEDTDDGCVNSCVMRLFDVVPLSGVIGQPRIVAPLQDVPERVE